MAHRFKAPPVGAGSSLLDIIADAARRPPDTIAVAKLGLGALDERLAEDALPIIIAAVQRAPHDAQLWHVLGLLHRDMGDLAAALKAFDEALRCTPLAATLLHARARTSLEAGVSSLDWFSRARAAAPKDGDVLLGHAAALVAEDSATSAEHLLDSTLLVHPGWIAGHSALIRLRFAMGDRDTYLTALDAAIEAAPRDTRLHALKFVTLLRARRHEQVYHAVRSARRQLGHNTVVRGFEAVAATEAGRLDEADCAFASIDPLADDDLTVNWLRHLTRRHRPDLIIDVSGRLDPHRRRLAWPYLSLAWRLLERPEAAWLDRPEFVRTVDVPLDAPSLDALAATLRVLHRTRGQPLDQSVRGGTQTDGPLLSRLDTPIREVRAHFHAAVLDYIADLPAAEASHPLLGNIPRRPRFAGSWSVRLSEGGYHDAHIHDHGWLSSAFYVALPRCEGPIDSGCLTLGTPQGSLGSGPGPERVIKPTVGKLVLFPSTLWHATKPFAGGERLTIAFDVD